ncbi:MAG: hypothetical protein EOR99_35010 [Mesorhizobium sp.]|nr:MAG: hypothetical protein EOR99_35010 [Mesorhizobium sp.]
MFAFLKARKTTKALDATTAKLIRAYDQLADGNHVANVEEFHAYGKRWNVDTVSLVDKARADLEQRMAEQSARMAERRKHYR